MRGLKPADPTCPDTMRDARLLAVVLAAVLTLGACSSTTTLDPRTWFSRDSTPPPKAQETPGVEARLRAIGSSANGVVRMRECGDLLVVRVELAGLNPGPHRVVLHANGNCSSPNGFSAGEPWAPPGWRDPPARLIPELVASTDGYGLLTARIRGVRLGDAIKRSVLVYQGTTPQFPRPDTPNNVIACGAFEASRSLF